MISLNKKGFTLIELLVVIAIIGILATIVLQSISSARQKAQLAAFKSEVTSAIASILIDCDTNAAPSSPTTTDNTTWNETGGPITTVSCGLGGSGTFSTTADPSNTDIDCTATVTESGATFLNTVTGLAC